MLFQAPTEAECASMNWRIPYSEEASINALRLHISTNSCIQAFTAVTLIKKQTTIENGLVQMQRAHNIFRHHEEARKAKQLKRNLERN
jgi:hypothetical protein